MNQKEIPHFEKTGPPKKDQKIKITSIENTLEVSEFGESLSTFLPSFLLINTRQLSEDKILAF